ncbi:MAG TPA: cytochrome d ubiquinol oxidase subunit II [Candidatus Nanopelagicaceae bacterium]|nr:cytochrome d ubiquinol oxidase subunit II [Candidatus Nanopelagicaceae bacterium]
MSLQTLWFILIAVLWIGYFVLEGFDFGVGVILFAVSKKQSERRAVLTTLGPLWDGNEVWLLVAGGATFAAFPEWYATLFSGFYLPLFLILIGLIVRGVSLEYRSKYGAPQWRSRWDIAITVSSAIPALLWGVAFANIIKGVPLVRDSHGVVHYAGGFFNLLNPYALLGGLVTFSVFATHGAIFLALKTDGVIRERANALVIRLGLAATVFTISFLAWTASTYNDKLLVWILASVVALAWVAALTFNRLGREGWSFLFSAIALAFAVITLFATLYPNVMPSSLSPDATLTITNASSTHYTLRIMTIVAAVMTPIVLVYQSWTYWVFRKRISAHQIPSPESGILDTIHP